MPPGSEYPLNLVSKAGDHFTVYDDNEAAAAFARGARYETVEEDAARGAAQGVADRYKGAGSAVQGALEAGARGVTGGLSDLALGALGDQYTREGLAGRKAAHPTLNTVVEVGAMLGSALAPTGLAGEGAAAFGRATPVGALSHFATGVAEREVAGVGVRAAAKRAARVIGAGAMENAALSVGMHLGAVGRGEEDLNAEHLITDAGKDALIGGVVTGGAVGGAALLGRARKAIKASTLFGPADAATVRRAGEEARRGVDQALTATTEAQRVAAERLKQVQIAEQHAEARARDRLLQKQAAAAEAKAKKMEAEAAKNAKAREAIAKKDREAAEVQAKLDADIAAAPVGAPIGQWKLDAKAKIAALKAEAKAIREARVSEIAKGSAPTEAVGTGVVPAEAAAPADDLLSRLQATAERVKAGESIGDIARSGEAVPAAFPKGSQPTERIRRLDEAAINTPDAAGVTPLQREMAADVPAAKQIVDAMDEAYVAGEGVGAHFKYEELRSVDPVTADMYRGAIADATPDMPVRKVWRGLHGEHGRGAGGGLGPPLNLTLDELSAQTTPGRIREALRMSNAAERKAILDRLTPEQAWTVLRGRFHPFRNIGPEGRPLMGGEWHAPVPGKAPHPSELGYQWFGRHALGTEEAGIAGLTKRAEATAEGVPVPAAKGSPPGGFDLTDVSSGVPVPVAGKQLYTLDDIAAELAADREVSAARRVARAEAPEIDEVVSASDGIAALQRQDASNHRLVSLLGDAAPPAAVEMAIAREAELTAQATKAARRMGQVAQDAPVNVPTEVVDQEALAGGWPGAGRRRKPREPYSAPLPASLEDRMRYAGWDLSPINEPAPEWLKGPPLYRNVDEYEAAMRADFGPRPGPPKVGLPRNAGLRAQFLADFEAKYGPYAGGGRVSGGEALASTIPGSPAAMRAETLTGGLRAGDATLPGFAGEAIGVSPVMPKAESPFAGWGVVPPSPGVAGVARGPVPTEGRFAASGVRGAASDTFRRFPEMPGRGPEGISGTLAELVATPATGRRGRGLLSSLADVGTALEAAQMLGWTHVVDFDKVPIVGPVLKLYLKYRGVKWAARRLGFRLAGGGVHAANAAGVGRQRMMKAVDKLLAVGQRGFRAAGVVGMSQAWRIDDALQRPLDPSAVERDKRKRMSLAELTKARAAEARALAANPDAAASSVRRRFAAVEDRIPVDPDLVDATIETQQRANEYLAKHAPVEPPPSLFRKVVWEPMLAESVKYARRVRVVRDPSTIYDDIQNGTLTTEAAEAFREVYPLMYEDTRAYLLDKAAQLEVTLSPEYVASLSILFQAPLRPTMDPDSIRRLQEAGVPPHPAGVPGGAAVAPPPGGPSDLASAYTVGPYRPPAQ